MNSEVRIFGDKFKECQSYATKPLNSITGSDRGLGLNNSVELCNKIKQQDLPETNSNLIFFMISALTFAKSVGLTFIAKRWKRTGGKKTTIWLKFEISFFLKLKTWFKCFRVF